jgi:hypothetical protein
MSQAISESPPAFSSFGRRAFALGFPCFSMKSLNSSGDRLDQISPHDMQANELCEPSQESGFL